MKQLLVLICRFIMGSDLLKAQEKVDMAVVQQIKDGEKITPRLRYSHIISPMYADRDLPRDGMIPWKALPTHNRFVSIQIPLVSGSQDSV